MTAFDVASQYETARLAYLQVADDTYLMIPVK